MLANILLLAAIIGTVKGVEDTPESKLIFVQEVFRHGARYPLGANDKDGSNISIIHNAIGELTRQGKSQHYLLGRKMYDTYWSQMFSNQTKYKQ